MVNVTQIFGIIASILSASLYISQLIHMINLKSGKDISYIFLFLQIIASIIWVIYGYYINSLPIILCDTFMFFITMMMIMIKYKFSLNENLDE